MNKPRHVIVTNGEWRVLTTLQQFGGSATVATVARQTGVTDATVDAVMRRLRTKRLVSRVEIKHTGMEYYHLRKGISVEVRFEKPEDAPVAHRTNPAPTRKAKPAKKQIHFHLTETEKARVVAAAAADGSSISEYIRKRL